MKALIKQPEQAPKNESFMSNENLIWFHFIMNYLPPINKPVVFLPCGSANKTRKLDGRKYISKGLSHEFMSAITRNDTFCKIILSEPLSLIPYDLESHPLRKDYNLPPDYLSIQSEILFIHNVSLYLARLKTTQPTRQYIYYVGATHHFFILYYANQLAGTPFELIFKIPPKGLTDYASSAKELAIIIQEGLTPTMILPSLEDHIKKRGRYTNLRFWKQILLMKKELESTEQINNPNQYQNGFSSIYQFFFNIPTKTTLQSFL